MVMIMAYSFLYNPATNKQSHERHACEGKSGVLYTPSLWARVMLSLSTKSHVTYFPLLNTQQSVVYTRWLPQPLDTADMRRQCGLELLVETTPGVVKEAPRLGPT